MPTKVMLTVTRGRLAGEVFVFTERATCLIGRADDCQPRLPDDEDHRAISRHHCLLDINPPDARVRDFGSLNGTYVNGAKIGQREEHQSPEEAARIAFPEYDLKNGDEIALGETVFHVGIEVPALCSRCFREIPEDQKAESERTQGVYKCPTCIVITATPLPDVPAEAAAKVCAQCGRDVAGEMGDDRRGEFVCAACKDDPSDIVDSLIHSANAGDEILLAIRGYRIVKKLGQGGMGAVYLARHEATGEVVALKVILPRVAVRDEARARFLREAENTRALRHPNVVRLRDMGCSHGTFFFTLEYCDGGSVDMLMEQRGGRLSIREAGEIVIQALEGLEYAHNAAIPHANPAEAGSISGRGLVHRDLKPHNLFLSGSGSDRVVKVGDFGLAKAFDLAGLSGQTATGAAAGTPKFVPRQQVINFKYARPEVDVWAMAACFYSMVTGFPPRDFPFRMDPFLAVLQTHAVPIRSRNEAIPARLADVIDHALIDMPAIPFKSASDFRRVLESVL
jgi:eukaryotic-like serine/threonine-protein kinase